VRYLQSIFEGLPIYIGDDNSDELAFKVVGERGITIAVGRTETEAQYRFRDEKEVLSFLSILGGKNGAVF
jgi:trehalose 6-phosphate phosphatase